MPTWEDVLAIGLALPGVERHTSFGTPALRVRKKFVCRLRTKPDALVVRVIDLEERAALLQAWPEEFFTTDHYDDYPIVLVRLEAVDPERLVEVVEDAWRTQAPKRLVDEHDARA